MSLISDLSLFAVAFAFLAMGAGSLVNPAAVTRQFGIGILDRDGRNEVRAVYGGFGIAVATTLCWAFFAPTARATICTIFAVALFGMAAGRTASAIWDRGLSRVRSFGRHIKDQPCIWRTPEICRIRAKRSKVTPFGRLKSICYMRA